MNSVVRSAQGQLIAPGTQDGQWMWDGQNWICVGCDGSTVPPFPCPPPGFPPAGCPPWFSGMNSPPWYPGANAGVSFGLTAPANAVRGHFWWNGSALMIFDGAVWVNTATGVITNPDGTPGNGGGGGGGGGSSTGTVVISSTAPGNPVPGMQWWNGTVLQMWDGTQWKLIGPGQAAGPVPTTTIVFGITQSTSVALGGASVWRIVPFTGTPQVDSLQGYNATTKQYKPTKAGMYFLMARSNAGAGGGVTIVKNDDGTFSGLSTETVIGIATAAAPGGWLYVAGMTLMNGTTDFVRLFAWETNGTFGAQGQNPAFSAVLMP